MRYLSVCSGIEAATAAWHPLGWEPVAFSEVDAFPSAVLKHHYPSVPNWGDMTKFQEWLDADVDVLVGGTPCQSFSVAGLRAGLADPRGNLMLTYLAIARRYRPRWVVWENVPGVLSSNRGRDFGTFLGGLAECGYGFAYRVLDAQHFGLAQRRKRVFVVGCLGDWRRAAAVLFERESLSGHPAPRREARQVAPTVPARRTAGGGFGTDFDCDGGLIPQTVGALDTECGGNKITHQSVRSGHFLPVAHSLRADGFDASEDGTGRGTPLVPVQEPIYFQDDATPKYGSTVGALRRDAGGFGACVAHAFDARQSDVIQYGDQTGPLDTDGSSIGVMTLAIRGRAGGVQLEVREDGTSNAILTPSGGRAGIGVGAVAFTTEQTPKWNADQALTLTKGSPTGGGQPQAVAFSAKDYGADAGDIAPTLRAGGHATSHANGGVMPAVATHMAVRRLTPRECERLQGFPDDYTLIPYGKPSKRKLDADFLKYQLRGNPKHLKRDDIDRIAADGPRYKALGNSMAVPVMAWIGKRIQMVEEL